MSGKALEWARTHYFESSAVVRTAILRFLAEQADDDGYIADHAGDKGISFIMHETCASKSTVIRTLKEFEAANLLHRERRPYKNFGGRPTDLIVLHLSVMGNKQPWRTVKAIKQLHRDGRELFGASFDALDERTESVENSSSAPGATLTPSYETPSQKLGATLTPSDDISVTLTQAKCHSDISEPVALIGTRARIIPKTFPISQSVKESTVVDNSQTDGLNEETKNQMSTPAITRGVNHQELRRSLFQAGHDASSVTEKVMAQIIHIIFARSTQDVRSPQRFALSCISKEFHELVSLAESVIEHKTPATAPQRITCPVHHTEHLVGRECPGCRADRIASQND